MKKILNFFFASVTLFFLAQCNNESKPTETAGTPEKSVTANWKLGVQLWTFYHFDFVTAIAKADSAGIKFIEAFPGQRMGGDFTDSAFDISLSAAGRTKAKELLKSKGIRFLLTVIISLHNLFR